MFWLLGVAEHKIVCVCVCVYYNAVKMDEISFIFIYYTISNMLLKFENVIKYMNTCLLNFISYDIDKNKR